MGSSSRPHVVFFILPLLSFLPQRVTFSSSISRLFPSYFLTLVYFSYFYFRTQLNPLVPFRVMRPTRDSTLQSLFSGLVPVVFLSNGLFPIICPVVGVPWTYTSFYQFLQDKDSSQLGRTEFESTRTLGYTPVLTSTLSSFGWSPFVSY